MLGPPPTSKYFWFVAVAAEVDNARSRASSSDKSFVGVEMASDLGRTLRGDEPGKGKRNYLSKLVTRRVT